MFRWMFLVCPWASILLLGQWSDAQSVSALPQASMDLIMARYRQQLLREEPLSAATVGVLLESQRADGTWPDIRYDDEKPSRWEPREHLLRVRGLSLANALPGHDSHHAPEVRSAVLRGLDHWLEKRYQCSNWWHNQIGVPRAVRDIVVLLGPEIDGARRKQALEVIKQHRLRGTGANLVWSAELAFHFACLTGGTAQAEQAARRLWNEVSVGGPEGIQHDWSFYQHGRRLQSFSYGHSFVTLVVQTAWQLRGTPWELPEAQRAIISNYLLEGQQWMCRGIYTVPGTLDRSATRLDGLAGADLRIVLALWSDVHPERGAEIAAFLNRQTTAAAPQLQGLRTFPYGDFSAYHRPEFSFFLKTVSSRTRPTECINGENLKGVPYLHHGDHYLVRTGEEYSNLQPLWEWDKLPGLTMAPGLDTPERLPFTGGLGNGQSGAAVMDYRRTGGADKEVLLHARKLWGFHEGMVICLIAGVESRGLESGATTSLEQCRLNGPVLWKPAGFPSPETIPADTIRAGEAIWVLHNGAGYIPIPGPGRVEVDTGIRTGSWRTINSGQTDQPVTAPVLSLQLGHGTELKAGGYAIVGNATQQSVEAIAARPPWTVMRNDARCQSLRFGGGLCMAAFHEPLESADEVGLGVDAPCLAMWDDEHLWLCDPTHQGREVRVTRGTLTKSLTLPPHGAVLKHVWHPSD